MQDICNFIAWIILEVKNKGNFVEDVVLWNLIFSLYSKLSIEKRICVCV